MRTKRALFRGTTSFRRTLPIRRTHHPDSPAQFTGVYQGLAITGSPLPIYSPHCRDFFGSQSGRRSTLRCCGGFQPAADLLYQGAKRLLFPEEIRSIDFIPTGNAAYALVERHICNALRASCAQQMCKVCARSAGRKGSIDFIPTGNAAYALASLSRSER